MTGYTMDNSGAGFNDDNANNNRPPDMDDLESIILADGGYGGNQMDDGDVKPNVDMLNVANPAVAVSDAAGDDDGEFRSRCNTWPKRDQLSTLSVLDQQRLELQQLQQQQQSLDQLSYNELPQQDPLQQQEGYPSPCGPLPLVCEEDSSAMESETTNMDIKEEEPNPDSPQQNSSSSSSSSSSSTAAANTTAPGTPTLAAKSGARRNPWGNLSYADLITQAIQSSQDQRLTLAQIYDWLVKNVPYFAAKADSVSSIGWKVQYNNSKLAITSYLQNIQYWRRIIHLSRVI